MNSLHVRDGALFASALPLQTHLLGRARFLARDRADAEDLVQDTFERALRASSAPTEAVDLRPWLARVLTNLWIDLARARKARRRSRLALETVTPPASDAADPTERQQWRRVSLSEVQAALRDVPEPYRSTFQDHVLERRSYLAIAHEMGIRPSTVGTRVLRARKHLRRILVAKMETDAGSPDAASVGSPHVSTTGGRSE